MRSPSRLLVIGLVAVAAFVAVGLVLVQRVGKTYEDGLEVAADSAALAVDAAEPLASMTDNLIDFARVAETGIEEARSIVASAQVSIAQLGESAATDLAEMAEGLASVADDIAGVIETIERFIPGDPQSAAEDLRQIADGLEPVPDDLRTLGAQLQETATELEAVDPTLAELGDDGGRPRRRPRRPQPDDRRALGDRRGAGRACRRRQGPRRPRPLAGPPRHRAARRRVRCRAAAPRSHPPRRRSGDGFRR